ncbi:hypothetical protein V565_247590, partial [Rhizoctonia solani 123E]
MLSSKSSPEKFTRKRKSYEPEFNTTVRTYGGGAKKSNTTVPVPVAEPPLPPKLLSRISGMDNGDTNLSSSSNSNSDDHRSSRSESDSGRSNPDSEVLNGKKKTANAFKGEKRKYRSKSNKRKQQESSESSDNETAVDSKGKKKVKHGEKRKSKFKKRKQPESVSESSEGESVTLLTDLAPETQAAIAKLIKKDQEEQKKNRTGAGPNIKSESSNAKVKSKVKREEGRDTRMPAESEAHSMIVNYLRIVLFQLTGWENMYNIQAPLEGLDDKGKPKYWEVSDGDNKLCPRIEDSFDSNWKNWGSDFVCQWRDEELMGVNREYLSLVSDDTIMTKFKTVTWKSMKEAWKKNKNGSQARNTKNVKSAERNRIVNKVQRRSEACKGTPLETPELKFLTVREYMSPEASDAEDDTRVIVDDPSHRSDI